MNSKKELSKAGRHLSELALSGRRLFVHCPEDALTLTLPSLFENTFVTAVTERDGRTSPLRVTEPISRQLLAITSPKFGAVTHCGKVITKDANNLIRSHLYHERVQGAGRLKKR